MSQIVIGKSAEKTLTFTKGSELGVNQITLITTDTAAITNGEIAIRQTKVGSPISSAIEKGDVHVYIFLSITKRNIDNSELESATITFEVPKNWTNDNNIDPATINLNRYVSQQWTVLPTTQTASTTTKFVYEAKSSGFSIFAISGEVTPPVVINLTNESEEILDEPVSLPEIQANVSTEVTPEEDQTISNKGLVSVRFLFTILAILILASILPIKRKYIRKS